MSKFSFKQFSVQQDRCAMKVGTDGVLLGAWCPIDNNPFSILDIGAGTGDFLSVAKENGWHTIGVEPSEKAKAIAKKKGVSFVGETSELDNHSFDVISMWHVLEHVPNLENQIKEAWLHDRVDTYPSVVEGNETQLIHIEHWLFTEVSYIKIA